MRPLPNELRYAYLDGSNKYPVIINAGLSRKEENKLLEILKRHKKVFGYSLTDFKVLNRCLGMHKIPIIPDSQPFLDQQQRLNPRMKEVVRKEVIRLLDAGII